jgi:hypothetical protein
MRVAVVAARLRIAPAEQGRPEIAGRCIYLRRQRIAKAVEKRPPNVDEPADPRFARGLVDDDAIITSGMMPSGMFTRSLDAVYTRWPFRRSLPQQRGRARTESNGLSAMTRQSTHSRIEVSATRRRNTLRDYLAGVSAMSRRLTLAYRDVSSLRHTQEHGRRAQARGKGVARQDDADHITAPCTPSL